MRKALSMLLVVAVICGWSVAAFGAPIFINIGTGSVGGTYYPVGSAMSTIWNRELPNMRASVQSTGGTRANIDLLARGEIEVGFTDGLYYPAFNGLHMFEGNPQPFLRAMVPLYPEPINLVVAEGSGITSIRDLRGRRVVIGPVGSGTEVTARAFLGALGICPDNDIIPQQLSMAEAASALADRVVDAAFMMGAIGMAAVMETTTMGTGRIIPIEDDLVALLNEVLPYYSAFTIPGGLYPGHSYDIPTSATWNILSVHQDVDADLVYAMTRALFENAEELVNVAAVMSYMQKDALHVVEIPLHPGAERFFRSAGVIQ